MGGVRVPRAIQTRDPELLAAKAGLDYVPDDEPGYLRRRCGKGFSYLDLDGCVIGDHERERLEALVIPPAWTDVWMAPVPTAHLLATGRDADGRKQYRYHQDFTHLTESLKFARLTYFGKALRRLRPHLVEQLDPEKAGSQTFALAAATRLIDTGYLRVGNDVYKRSSGAQGATTLTDAEVNTGTDADGTIRFEFNGKSGKQRQVDIDDPLLNAALDELIELPTENLFSYETDEGARSITSSGLNAYIAQIIGPAFTAKDFRTWGGTVSAAEALLAGEDALRAYDHAAEVLGNTRAVARSSYVAPALIKAHETGHLEDLWRSSRSGKWLDRVESCVEKALQNTDAQLV